MVDPDPDPDLDPDPVEASSIDPTPDSDPVSSSSILHRQEEKAVQADDAAIPYRLWDNAIWEVQLHSEMTLQAFHTKFSCQAFLHKYSVASPCPLVVLRHFVLGQWQWNVYCSLVRFMEVTYGKKWLGGLSENSHRVTTVQDVLHRVCRASYWEWVDGSALIFW